MKKNIAICAVIWGLVFSGFMLMARNASAEDTMPVGNSYTQRTIEDTGDKVKEISLEASTDTWIAISTTNPQTNSAGTTGWRERYVQNCSTSAELQLRFNLTAAEITGTAVFTSSYSIVLGSSAVSLDNRTYKTKGQEKIYGIHTNGKTEGGFGVRGIEKFDD